MKLLTVTFALLLIWLLPAYGESASERKAALEAMSRSTTLKDPALTPWHLRVNFTRTADAGLRPEHGTIDEWWQSPNTSRVDIHTDRFDTSVLTQGDQQTLLAGRSDFAAADMDLVEQFTEPISPSVLHDGVRLTRKQFKGGVSGVNCLIADPKEHQAFPQQIFCSSPGSSVPDIVQSADRNILTRRRGTFQGKSVPVDLTIEIRTSPTPTPSTEAHLDQLTGMSPAEVETVFRIPPNTHPEAVCSSHAGKPPKLIHQVEPTVPRSLTLQSPYIVIVALVIDEQGRPVEPQVIRSSNAEASSSALSAVSKYLFAPALDSSGNGVRCPVNIEVNFQNF